MRTHIYAGASALALMLAAGTAHAQTASSTAPSWVSEVVITGARAGYAAPAAASATRSGVVVLTTTCPRAGWRVIHAVAIARGCTL